MRDETQSLASYVQRSMWATAQRFRGAPLNLMVLPWRVTGRLDVGLLQNSLTALVSRHPTLRSHLAMRAGSLYQVTAAVAAVSVTTVQAKGATADQRHERAIAQLRERGQRPLDVSGPSPMEVWYTSIAPDDGILCFFVHHAMCDGWSSQVMARDLAALYEGAELAPLEEQFSHFAAWQRTTYESGGFDAEIRYWRQELEDLPPPLALPTIAPRKGARDWHANSPVLTAPSELLEAVRAAARRHRVSVFVLLLGTLSILLYRRTGAEDMVIGVPTLNRRGTAAQMFVGCATNLLPARVRVRSGIPIGEFFQQLHATVRRLLAYGRLPLELLLRETQDTLLAGPVFPIWCQYREMSEPTVLAQAGVTLTPFVIERGALQSELDVDILAGDGALDCEFVHRPSLFGSAMVEGLMGDFSELLGAVTVRDGATVGALSSA